MNLFKKQSHRLRVEICGYQRGRIVRDGIYEKVDLNCNLKNVKPARVRVGRGVSESERTECVKPLL